MVKVKICGITNLEDALAAFFSGADAVGFVFYKKSPRYITLEKASRISKILPKSIKRVGVFVNASESRIKKTARKCNLDMLQFHGDEAVDVRKRGATGASRCPCPGASDPARVLPLMRVPGARVKVQGEQEA